MAAIRITDPETGEEVVYGKDGRRMNPKSLKNVADKSNGLQKHPENRMTNGAKNPIKLIKEELIAIGKQKLNPKDEYSAIQKVVREMYKIATESKNEHNKIRVFQELRNSIDGIEIESQRKSNPLNINLGGVMLLNAHEKEKPKEIDKSQDDEEQ